MSAASSRATYPYRTGTLEAASPPSARSRRDGAFRIVRLLLPQDRNNLMPGFFDVRQQLPADLFVIRRRQRLYPRDRPFHGLDRHASILHRPWRARRSGRWFDCGGDEGPQFVVWTRSSMVKSLVDNWSIKSANSLMSP